MRVIDRVASHIFIRRLVPRDLDQLHCAEHRNPDQLQANPDVQNDGKGVPKDEATQCAIENIALRLCRLR